MHIISGIVSIPLHWPAEHRAELPWDFYFPQVHYAVAWIAIGSSAIHIAVKIPVLWRALRQRDERYREPESAPGLSWRGFSRTTWLASGVAVIATAGAIPLLRNVSGLAWRSAYGSQGLPARTQPAIGAGVIPGAQDPNWRGSPVVARLWRSAAARPGQGRRYWAGGVPRGRVGGGCCDRRSPGH